MSDSNTPLTILVRPLIEDGASYMPAQAIKQRVQWSEQSELAAACDDLPADEYLDAERPYRFRRYRRLIVRHTADQGHRVFPQAPVAFHQSAELIPLYEGQQRMFAPLPIELLSTPAMLGVLAFDLKLISQAEGRRRDWMVGLHLIRVLATASLDRLPAPEGRHRDGHAYVAMHLVSRAGCTGGDSRIYRGSANEPMLEVTLRTQLDTILIDDQRVEHEVTAIRPVEGQGVRDMLLVDFDPLPSQDHADQPPHESLALRLPS
jgi:hypothetical protein